MMVTTPGLPRLRLIFIYLSIYLFIIYLFIDRFITKLLWTVI